MDQWSKRTLTQCIFVYIVLVFVQSAEMSQDGLNEESDAIIWGVKQVHFYLRHVAGTVHGNYTHKVSAYYANPVKHPQNESLQGNLMFPSIWTGAIWTMFADYHAHRIYFNNHLHNFIGIFDVKTKELKKVFQGLAWGIDGIGVDWVSGNVYWTDTNYNWIMVANRNFSHYRNITTINSKIPAKIAVHPTSGHLYWSERQDGGCSIYRSDLRGENKRLLHNFSHVQAIRGLSIDYAEDRLYWTERLKSGAKHSAIRYCDLKTADYPVYFVTNSTHAFFESVAVYKNHLYVTDDLNNAIVVVDKISKKVVLEKKLGVFKYPRAITAYTDTQRLTNTTFKDICANSTCEHLSIPDSKLDNCTCECSTGFHLLPDKTSCGTTIVYDEFALVVDKAHSKLYQLNMLSPNVANEIPVQSIKTPTAADYDWSTKTVFWADHDTNTISKYSLENKTENVIINRTPADAIALDVTSRNIYFVNEEAGALFVADMDGKHVHTLHTDHIFKVTAMTIDHIRGYIYWSGWGQSDSTGNHGENGVVRSSRLDGSDVRIVVNSTATPTGLAIDHTHNILFWAQGTAAKISWINLTDSTTGTFKLPDRKYRGLAADMKIWRGRLYVAEKYGKQIVSVSVEKVIKMQNGSEDDVQPFGPRSFFQAASIHIYSSVALREGSTICSNSTCPHLCLPNHANNTVKPQCVCQDHFTYFEGNNSCVQHGPINDTKRPSFGNTCPEPITAFLQDCRDQEPVHFKVPTATDDSGAPVRVTAMTDIPQIPVYLSEGSHEIHYIARDKSHNRADCRFSIIVIRLKCHSFWVHIPKNAKRGPPSCSNKIGSKMNVTCIGTDIQYQLECRVSGRWQSRKRIICPVSPKSTTTGSSTSIDDVTNGTANPIFSKDVMSSTSRSPLLSQDTSIAKTTKAHPFTSSSSHYNVLTSPKVLPEKQAIAKTNPGMVAGIVVAVLVVLLGAAAFIFVYRRRGINFFPGRTNWRRSEDHVYLTEHEEKGNF